MQTLCRQIGTVRRPALALSSPSRSLLANGYRLSHTSNPGSRASNRQSEARRSTLEANRRFSTIAKMQSETLRTHLNQCKSASCSQSTAPVTAAVKLYTGSKANMNKNLGGVQQTAYSPGTAVRSASSRSLVPLFPSSLVPLFPVFLVPLFPRSLVPLFPVFLVPLFPSSLVPLFPRSLVPLFPVFLTPHETPHRTAASSQS